MKRYIALILFCNLIYGADPSLQTYLGAVRSDDIDNVHRFLNRAPELLDQRDILDCDAVCYADLPATVEYLLMRGIKINSEAGPENTVSHICRHHNTSIQTAPADANPKLDIMKLLLQHKASFSSR